MKGVCRGDDSFNSYLYDYRLSTEYTYRKAEIVPLSVKKVEMAEFRKSYDWQFLPEHLRNLYDSGQVLMVGSDQETEVVVSRYSALVISGKAEAFKGRVGILLYDGYPIVITISGKTFFIEAKGIIAGEEGFVSVHRRSGRVYEVTGAQKAQSSLREFGALEYERSHSRFFKDADTPRALAALVYKYPQIDRLIAESLDSDYEREQAKEQLGDKLGMILRLSPSSLRAAYNLERRHIRVLGELTARLLCSPVPRIHLSPHFENILEWAEGQEFCWSDYGDVRPLFSRSSYHWSRTLLNARRILNSYFEISINWNADLMKKLGIIEDEGQFIEDYLRGFVDYAKSLSWIPPQAVKRFSEVKTPNEFIDVLIFQVFAFSFYRAVRSEQYQQVVEVEPENLLKLLENALAIAQDRGRQEFVTEIRDNIRRAACGETVLGCRGTRPPVISQRPLQTQVRRNNSSWRNPFCDELIYDLWHALIFDDFSLYQYVQDKWAPTVEEEQAFTVAGFYLLDSHYLSVLKARSIRHNIPDNLYMCSAGYEMAGNINDVLAGLNRASLCPQESALVRSTARNALQHAISQRLSSWRQAKALVLVLEANSKVLSGDSGAYVYIADSGPGMPIEAVMQQGWRRHSTMFGADLKGFSRYGDVEWIIDSWSTKAGGPQRWDGLNGSLLKENLPDNMPLLGTLFGMRLKDGLKSGKAPLDNGREQESRFYPLFVSDRAKNSAQTQYTSSGFVLKGNNAALRRISSDWFSTLRWWFWQRRILQMWTRNLLTEIIPRAPPEKIAKLNSAFLVITNDIKETQGYVASNLGNVFIIHPVFFSLPQIIQQDIFRQSLFGYLIMELGKEDTADISCRHFNENPNDLAEYLEAVNADELSLDSTYRDRLEKLLAKFIARTNGVVSAVGEWFHEAGRQCVTEGLVDAGLNLGNLRGDSIPLRI
ncbi:MAG: hypothetical protein ABIH91_01740, partial [Candidatus Omnitrophota bacterium]